MLFCIHVILCQMSLHDMMSCHVQFQIMSIHDISDALTIFGPWGEVHWVPTFVDTSLCEEYIKVASIHNL